MLAAGRRKNEYYAVFRLISLGILNLDLVGFGTKNYGSSMPKFYGTILKPILLKIVPKATIWQPWPLRHDNPSRPVDLSVFFLFFL